jgi:hypothetical protein
MGRGILIVEPQPIAQTSGAAASRLITPNPKEAIAVPANQVGVSFDLAFGRTVTFDTFYIGYHGAPAGSGAVALFQAIDGIGGTVTGNYTGNVSMEPTGYGPPYHTVARLAAPVSAAFLRVVINGNGAGFNVGTFAYGLAFQTEYGEERGGGGLIEDTGSVERLFGGGFGIDEGVATTGYQWSFGDLQDAERRQLFQIVKRLRTTRSFLMVENPAQTEGLNERIHWGNLRKLEAYERIDPRNSKWSLSMWDWN